MMIILFVLIFFLDMKTEEFANIREGLNSKDSSIFTNNVDKVLKINKEELSEDFKKFLILKAIEKFDEELMPLMKKNIILDIYKVLETFIGEPKKYYRNSILKLFIYVSSFSNSGYEEELLNRLVTKELIMANYKKIINIIKKREKEINSNKNLINSVYFLLTLSNNKAISIDGDEQDYLKNIFKRVYENLEEDERCSNFTNYIPILKEILISDEKIIQDASICICKENEFAGVLTYYFAILEAKIKGADKLLSNCLNDIKDNKIKEIIKKLEKENLQASPFKLNDDDFSYLSENSFFKNPCCK